jgi:hypothetical protein
MVRVKLGGPLMSQAGGTTEFEVEAATIRDLLAKLANFIRSCGLFSTAASASRSTAPFTVAPSTRQYQRAARCTCSQLWLAGKGRQFHTS